MKHYAIPDIHGRLDLLELALGDIERDDPGIVVFLGDYVDRGPHSRQVVDRLVKGPPDGWKWVCLAGNHELWMASMFEYGHAEREWLECGGGATLKSYGVKSVMKYFGENEYMREHVHWIYQLPLYHETEHHVFVHAAVSENIPLEEQSSVFLTWGIFNRDAGWNGKHVVHGHEGIPTGPKLYRNRTNLDCRACDTGRLVVGVFDGPGGPVETFEAGRRAQ